MPILLRVLLLLRQDHRRVGKRAGQRAGQRVGRILPWPKQSDDEWEDFRYRFVTRKIDRDSISNHRYH